MGLLCLFLLAGAETFLDERADELHTLYTS